MTSEGGGGDGSRGLDRINEGSLFIGRDDVVAVEDAPLHHV